jgi:EAL and modified HD-GYP domain-containing signal transduction protein
LVDASTMVFHWESLTVNALAFVSLGEQELLSGVALILPRTKAVIEIADSAPCTTEVILACQGLKTAGYRMALRGWTGNKEQRPLAALADFLLVDAGKLTATE